MQLVPGSKINTPFLFWAFKFYAISNVNFVFFQKHRNTFHNEVNPKGGP